jgi:hypothetical protein
MTSHDSAESVSYASSAPSAQGFPIVLFQSQYSRAINVGFLSMQDHTETFIPGRLNFGTRRIRHTVSATLQTFGIPPISAVIGKYPPERISTITLLREALAYGVGSALYDIGVREHYGDVFIGANHVKNGTDITTAYQYENIEGLAPGGLWIVADSICVGRNLIATLASLFAKTVPEEILFIAPIASRSGIDTVAAEVAKQGIPATFVAWGALFGVDARTRYDMPWGHPSTEPLDARDRDTFLSMYGPELCVGGDFGNAYYCPPRARALYEDQLKTHGIVPRIPDPSAIRARYHTGELLVEH